MIAQRPHGEGLIFLAKMNQCIDSLEDGRLILTLDAHPAFMYFKVEIFEKE